MTVVRTASQEDLDALLALENACFTSDRMNRRSCRRFIRVDTATVLLAIRDDRPVGSLVLSCRRGSAIARIYSIAVAGDHRGQGVGTRLVEAAETVALAQRHPIVQLEVRMDNAGSLALFHRMGYEKFGTFPQYYEDGEDAVRLRKYLTESH